MTAIVALVENGVVWMGGDSAAVSSDYSLTIRRDEKVFVNGGILIGYTSSFRMGQLLRYSFQPPQQPEGQCDVEYMNTAFIEAVRVCLRNGGYATNTNGNEAGGKFLVGYRGCVYQVEADFQVALSYDSYAACGCGGDVCLGSLYSTQGQQPEQRIRQALEAAEHHSGGVRGPFVIRNM
jgi:hypothetical protein